MAKHIYRQGFIAGVLTQLEHTHQAGNPTNIIGKTWEQHAEDLWDAYLGQGPE